MELKRIERSVLAAPVATARPRGRRAAIAIALALAVSAFPADPGDGTEAAAASGLPSRPLPPDYVEGFGEGKILAFHYAASYVCLTTPSSDLDPPFGRGDGFTEAEDPTEYQAPPCFVGDTGTGSIPPFAPDGKPLSKTRKLYGISLAEDAGKPSSGVYLTNVDPLTDVQTQCAQPGPPYTQYKGAPGTCLMHPSILRVAEGVTVSGLQVPDPALGPQHSHIIEGTSSPLAWWHVNAVIVRDRSIFPDLDGNCPAGPPKCLTSLRAMRAAQESGLAAAELPTNGFFFFSVQPEAFQPEAFRRPDPTVARLSCRVSARATIGVV